MSTEQTTETITDTNVSKAAPPGPVNTAEHTTSDAVTPQTVAEQGLEEGTGAEQSPSDTGEKPEVQIPDKNDEAVSDKPTPPKKVEDFVKQAGLNPTEVTKALMENGGQLDPDMLKALVETHGEGVADLVQSQLETFHDNMKSAQEAKDKLLFDQLEDIFKDVTEQSGQETWTELQGWAQDNIEAKDREELNGLLRQGGLAAKLAIQELGNAFKEANNYTKPVTRIEGDNLSNNADFDVGGIDQSSYVQELDALLAKGHSYDSQQVKRLQSRRTRGMRAGI